MLEGGPGSQLACYSAELRGTGFTQASSRRGRLSTQLRMQRDGSQLLGACMGTQHMGQAERSSWAGGRPAHQPFCCAVGATAAAAGAGVALAQAC